MFFRARLEELFLAGTHGSIPELLLDDRQAFLDFLLIHAGTITPQ